MIQFDNLSQELPYQVFKEKYENSLNAKQKNIEAICISSYSSKNNEVNARYVNLKFVSGKQFIFFQTMNHLSLKILKCIIKFQPAFIGAAQILK